MHLRRVLGLTLGFKIRAGPRAFDSNRCGLKRTLLKPFRNKNVMVALQNGFWGGFSGLKRRSVPRASDPYRYGIKRMFLAPVRDKQHAYVNFFAPKKFTYVGFWPSDPDLFKYKNKKPISIKTLHTNGFAYSFCTVNVKK